MVTPNLQLYGGRRVAPSRRALYRVRHRVHLGVMFDGSGRVIPLCKRYSTSLEGIIQHQPENTTRCRILWLGPCNTLLTEGFLGDAT